MMESTRTKPGPDQRETDQASRFTQNNSNQPNGRPGGSAPPGTSPNRRSSWLRWLIFIVAKRFMKGFLEGMKTYLEDEDFSVKVIQKWTRTKNREEIKEAYALQARHMLRVPRTSLEGVKTILEGMDRIPAAKTADPRRFVDSSVLDELEKEGFLKTLYKN